MPIQVKLSHEQLEQLSLISKLRYAGLHSKADKFQKQFEEAAKIAAINSVDKS